MNWYFKLIAEAGLNTSRKLVAALFPLLVSCLLAIATQALLGVFALSVAVAFLSLALELELLRQRASHRKRVIAKAWPEVVDSLYSAFQSGISPARAFEDLAEYSPRALQASFRAMSSLIRAGHTFENCLTWLQNELATEVTDRTIELLRLIDQLGGQSAGQVLSDLASDLRKDLEFENELAAKQGWVVTTAKLGLVAPWLIVVMLSRRPEAAAAYNSTLGTAALVIGLAVCLLAYFLIQFMGAEVVPKRVFSRAQ